MNSLPEPRRNPQPMQGEGGHEVGFTAYGREINHGVPVFLDQLVNALGLGLMSNPEIGRTALLHGHDLLRQGFSLSQVVHDYGDVCQSITELASETDAPISLDDFHTLNRCLDDAIAGAVTSTRANKISPLSMERPRRKARRLGSWLMSCGT